MTALFSQAPLICESAFVLVGDAQALLFLGSSIPLAGQAGCSRGGRQKAGVAEPRAEQPVAWGSPDFTSRQHGADWVVVEE